MLSTPTHKSPKRLTGALIVAVALATCLAALCVDPSDAHADMYTYQKADGSLLFTTSPRKGLKLIERIKDDSGKVTTKSGRKISAKHQRYREMAEQRRSRSQAARQYRAPIANRENMYDDMIREAARIYQLPFGFIKGVIKVESNFSPTVISPVGAMGLMQLMPFVADNLKVDDAFDPRQNILGGAKLLRTLTNEYNGDINLILSAYNAGEGAVARYGGIPYEKTREYVRKVYHYYKEYQRQESGDYSATSTATGSDDEQ